MNRSSPSPIPEVFFCCPCRLHVELEEKDKHFGDDGKGKEKKHPFYGYRWKPMRRREACHAKLQKLRDR